MATLPEAGANALKQLLEQPLPPHRRLLSYDVMALGRPRQLGLKVPGRSVDYRLINIALAEFCDPPTTAAQPSVSDIGREAMLLLLDQMQAKCEQRLAFTGLRADYSRFYARFTQSK